MRNITTYINGIDSSTYGIQIDEKSLTSLMTPPPVKPNVENKSSMADGKQVLFEVCKVDERNMQLIFFLQASDFAQFIVRYRSFCNVLKAGHIDLTVSVKDNKVEVFRVTYYLYYSSCSQYSEFNGRLAKFVLKVNEPNPNNCKIDK